MDQKGQRRILDEIASAEKPRIDVDAVGRALLTPYGTNHEIYRLAKRIDAAMADRIMDRLCRREIDAAQAEKQWRAMSGFPKHE